VAKQSDTKKGIETERGFKEVEEDKIVKGYQHTKGHHVIIKPEELDELKSSMAFTLGHGYRSPCASSRRS
jgi:non-homologous end joining protein Ku